MADKAKKKSPVIIIISVILVLCIAGGLVFAFRDRIPFLNKQNGTSVSDTNEKQITTPLGNLKLSGEWAETGRMYKDATMWVGNNDYGIVGGSYYFDSEGRMTTN